MSRIEYNVSELGIGVYPLLNACVVPRPIAWVSTLSADGIANVAPHSYFTVSSVQPPVIQFTSVGEKDSLRNIRATGEFVVCVATTALAVPMNHTATDFPPEVPEHVEAGITLEPSALVAPQRIAEAPVAMECRSAGERDFGGSVVVFGEVVRIAVSDWVAADDGFPDIRKLDPPSRLGRNDWGRLGEITERPRIPFAEWQAGRRA